MRSSEYQAVESVLTAAGAPFEVVPVRVGGLTLRGWKHAPQSLREILEDSRAYQEQPYLVFEHERLSYEEHFRLVARCATVLLERYGIKKGDRIAIAMRNLPEWSIAFWAAISVGAVAVSVNAWMTGGEMSYCIADSGSCLLVADSERLERLAEFLPGLKLDGVIAVRTAGPISSDVMPWEALLRGVDADQIPSVEVLADDDATVLYTSGTTGKPKGAIGSHRASCNNVVSTVYSRGVDTIARGGLLEHFVLRSPTSLLLSIPLFHGAGCQNGLISTMFSGGKMVMMTRWNADWAIDLIERERITDLVGSPAHFVQFLDALGAQNERRDLSSVRSVLVGGASPPADLPGRLRAVLPQAAIGTGYGQTECTQIATLSSGSDYLDHPTSCGRVIPICETQIVDDQGAPVNTGATGELLVRGPTLVKGYLNKPRETEETFAGGWLRTGDLVHTDADGRIYIDDRKKDMVIRGGENIYCIEVEQALYNHPDVMEAAVYGIPHPVLGEQPVATVHLREGSTVTGDGLRALVAVHLAQFKVPVDIKISQQPLPRNANGKILKRELRQALQP